MCLFSTRVCFDRDALENLLEEVSEKKRAAHRPKNVWPVRCLSRHTATRVTMRGRTSSRCPTCGRLRRSVSPMSEE